MKIDLDGKTYYVEGTGKGLRVGVVIINRVQAQHPYIRWLSGGSARAAQVIAAAGLGAEDKSNPEAQAMAEGTPDLSAVSLAIVPGRSQ
jgi:hypothetical protein